MNWIDAPRRASAHVCAAFLIAAVAGCSSGEPYASGQAGEVDRPAGDTDQDAPPPAADPPADPAPPAKPEPTGGACAKVADYLESWGAPTACDAALAAECNTVVGLFSDAYKDALEACIDEQHSPMACVVLALGDLQPTAAHHELASRFCDECALGVPGCETLFYFEDSEPIGLGAIALPFSDELVLKIANECTDGLTCSVELPSCAQGVIEEELAPKGLLGCLLDAVVG